MNTFLNIDPDMNVNSEASNTKMGALDFLLYIIFMGALIVAAFVVDPLFSLFGKK